MSYAMYPKVTEDFLKFKSQFGNVSCLDTNTFLVGPKIGKEIGVELAPGKTVYIKALAVTDVTENGEQEVFFNYNGSLRSGTIYKLTYEPQATITYSLYGKAIWMTRLFRLCFSTGIRKWY